MTIIHAVPTNVITGFLGTGKTTAISQLLTQKPAAERWAILVNEFGEVGIDGSMLTGQSTEDNGVFISEVPGGCMCCAAGLPMQIALNRLLSKAKPDRLLIEPTGLGHPKEVLQVLTAEHYHEVIDLRATITLVDARKISDPRYAGNATFRQQLSTADIIVANKTDTYQDGDLAALNHYLAEDLQLNELPVHSVSHGKVKLEWLLGRARQFHHHHQHDHAHSSKPLPQTLDLPEQGYLCIENEGEGFFSCGWIFKPDWVFKADKLYQLLLGTELERIKAVFITDQGIIAYNKVDDVLTEIELDEALDSRLECIGTDRQSLRLLEKALLACTSTTQ